MNIGLDFDDVIADYIKELFEFYNKKHNTNHKKEDSKEYAFWIQWGITKEKATKIIDEFHEKHEIELINPLEGALESITHLLNNKDKLYIITARPARFRKKTQDWISHHIKTDKIER